MRNLPVLSYRANPITGVSKSSGAYASQVGYLQSESASANTGMVSSDGTDAQRASNDLGCGHGTFQPLYSEVPQPANSQHRPHFHLGQAYRLRSPSIPPPIDRRLSCEDEKRTIRMDHKFSPQWLLLHVYPVGHTADDPGWGKPEQFG